MVRATRSAVTLIPDLAEWIDPHKNNAQDGPIGAMPYAMRMNPHPCRVECTILRANGWPMTNFLPIN